MAAIELTNVTKSWGKTVAVGDISFTVNSGTFVVLLGPSGCGKSTTLRMIAGLEEMTSGKVIIDGRDMSREPPSARRVSMVFQSYALFPHLDTRQNILFGLKVRRIERAERERRLIQVAEMVGLDQLLDRKPSQLSGGQRQRVALARAIVAENSICLMDEPLSNLDAKLRHEMRVEIRALQERLGMTVVYVTHDQTEAMSMADKVILMREGRIEQIGTPGSLYDGPSTKFCAEFIGTPPMNILRLADAEGGAVIAGSDGPAVVAGSGRDRELGIRPEHIGVSATGGVSATVTSCDYLGADTIVSAQIGAQEVLVRTPGRSGLASGETIGLTWSEADTHVFNSRNGHREDGVAKLPATA